MNSALVKATQTLAQRCRILTFSPPATTHVYHPLIYAWNTHRDYLTRYGGGKKKILFVGINPGPWGMAQTGVPFGDVASVRDWLQLQKPRLTPPPAIHPKRPVAGFSCPRREISGARLWAFFRARHQTAAAFFTDHFVLNYCPLLFLRANGKSVVNVTPDKLAAAERKPLYAACDDFLRAAATALRAQTIVGIGAFAEARLLAVFADDDGVRIGKMIHPSPANPAANKNFAAIAARQLSAYEND